MTKRIHVPTIVLLAAFLLFAGIAAAQSDPSVSAQGTSTDEGAAKAKGAKKSIRLEDATTIIELNATDGDAGLQVFADGEPWKSMQFSRPGGKTLLNVNTRGRLKRLGLTELFSESNEPEFKDLPLNEFKRLFPEGTYTYSGKTVEGDKLIGEAKLSHDTPPGPEITSPAAGATVPEDNVVAQWAPVPAPGIDVTGYRVIVERENPLRVFNADLPASQTSVTIPSEYLEPATEYKLEVQTIEASGNQTISEIMFRTG
jgi:Fibronectin type III domain